MAIELKAGHPSQSLCMPQGGERPPAVRIGIVNIMPRLEEYEPSLLRPLALLDERVEPVFIRLSSHAYQSSDSSHLARFYQRLEDAIAERPLDGLIVTGAPVEELAFDDVHYWSELEALLRYARSSIPITLGLCWGGLALGRMLGVDKQLYAKKLFGVFEDRVLVPQHELVGAQATFVCAHSRHSGVVSEDIDRAANAGDLRIVARGEQTGCTAFESSDLRFFAHLGHPEYEGARLAFEWDRDHASGRDDVDPPANFDAAQPHTTWTAHRQAIFGGLVARARRGADERRRVEAAPTSAVFSTRTKTMSF